MPRLSGLFVPNIRSYYIAKLKANPIKLRRSEMTTNGRVVPRVALVGAGSIGVAWAIVFAGAGCSVRLFDTSEDSLAAARKVLRARLDDLAKFGLIKDEVETISARVSMETDLQKAVSDAGHIQENIPEVLDLKRDLFRRLVEIAPPDCVIASSSSFIGASKIAQDISGRERCLVIHPGNPPYLIRVAEVIPAPFTSDQTVLKSERLLEQVGLVPVRINHEVEGFVFNRLQGAMLREAYCLVRDGVASVDDIDKIVRDGLGLRWSVMGPFETVDLNTRGGIKAHATRMGPAYERMGAERGQHDPWTEDLVARVETERRLTLALEQWEDRTAWRDRSLMALLAARQTNTK